MGPSSYPMRGYFGIGVERMSKAMNAGSLFRTAHAFGASFVFTVEACFSRAEVERADTSRAWAGMPYYDYADISEMTLPRGCSMVGVELREDATELPSFHHPRCCVYVMGPERGDLSPQMTERCDHVIRIPTTFCVNVAIAGALVMYDRLISLESFPLRPVTPGAKPTPLPEHVRGALKQRTKGKKN